VIWIKRILIFIIILIVLAGLTTAFVIFRYGDDLKRYAFQTIRSSVTTDVSFSDDATFSIWNDFPLVAVQINDIRIQDSFRTDTLISAGKAFVQFDLWKLLQSRFVIEGIRVEDGFFRLKRNQKGDWNFRVWKESETDNTNGTDVSIEILTLEKIDFTYTDKKVDLDIHFWSELSKLKGRFTDEDQRLSVSLNGLLHNLSTSGTKRITELPTSLAGILNINGSTQKYSIETGNAILAGNEMVFDMNWDVTNDATNMLLRVHAVGIEPHVLLPHVWPQMPEAITKLNLEGLADINVILDGPFEKSRGPELKASVNFRNGSLEFRDLAVSDVSFAGNLAMADLRRSSAMKITFDNFSLRTPSGRVSGKGALTDLNNPHLNLYSEGNSRLEEILKVVDPKNEIVGTGSIDWKIDFDGPLGHEFRTTMRDFARMKWSGIIDVSESELKFAEGIPPLREVSSRIVMDESETKLTDCRGSIGHLQFDGDASLTDLKSLLSDSLFPLQLKGNLHLKEIDIEKIPQEWKLEGGAGGNARPTILTASITIDRLNYKDFSATDLMGRLGYQDDRLRVTELRFDALGGSINSNIMFEPDQNGSTLGIEASLVNVDISRTLKEWNNFGQTTVTNENLRGRTSANLTARIPLDKDNKLLIEKMAVETDMEVSGGQLIDFEPLQALSRFISVDELKEVKFDTLRNHLTIRDNKLIIPRMTVSSSILNVEVFGEHSFKQELDYHVNLLLNDLLRRKAKRKEMFEGHEIVDEGGRTRLFLWIRGRPGDIKVGFDKKEVRQKLKEDLKKEGQSIKQLFKEEFRGEPNSSEARPVQFRLEGEVDESSKPKTETTKPSETAPKKKKGLFNTQPEKEETEGNFEIEFDP